MQEPQRNPDIARHPELAKKVQEAIAVALTSAIEVWEEGTGVRPYRARMQIYGWALKFFHKLPPAADALPGDSHILVQGRPPASAPMDNPLPF